MDTLDNANTTTNPFVVNSNNPDILAQKEGFVLNLADGFKQNGTEKSPSSELDFLSRPTNGKRSADEFDDDDDDLGPETDVDAVDDVLLSPAIAAAKSLAEGIINNNPTNIFDPFCEKEEKASLETDSELQKQQTSEFDSIKSPREETPTPPADSVLDASGLVDNVAESGEDSDDEWNYFKGDTATQKENIPPSQTDKEVCELTQTEDFESDTMSQLNPNAAEFVPISPKRNAASPTYQNLIDDSVIAQSPRRIMNNDLNVDISVPNPQEFECEIKSRPSDVQECANGDDEEHTQKLTSQEIMENLLNGKSIDEIEFQPISTPTKLPKPDEFHFGPNATPFSTPAKFDQSEALSTKAVFGDESTASYLDGKGFDSSFASSDVSEPQVCAKEQEDPMSMSFYQEKDDDSSPFDLNKVQVLPENIDEFLVEKPTEDNSLFNETISDLPEHNPMDNIVKSEITNEVAESHEINNDDVLIVESLGVSKSPIPESQSPLPVADSPLPESQCLIPDLESPLPTSRSPLPASQSPLPASQSPLPTSQSPLPASQSPLPTSQSPIPTSPSPLPACESPAPASQSPLPQSQFPLPGSPSPVPPLKSPLPLSQSPFPTSPSPVPAVQSPVSDKASPLPELHSPEPALQCQLPERDARSPLPTSQNLEIESQSPLPTVQSPLPNLERTESPLPESQSPLPPQSPLLKSQSPLPQSQSPLPQSQSPFPQSQSPLPQSQSPLPQSQSPLPQTQSPLPQSHSPLPESQSPLLQAQSPLLESHFPIPQSQSPLPQSQPETQCLLPESHSPLPESQSPLPPSQSPIPSKQSPLFSHSPVPTSRSPLPELESPVEDVTSSVKDSPVLAASPVETESKFIEVHHVEIEGNLCKEEPPVVSETCSINYAQEISNAVVETMTPELASPTDNKLAEDLIADACLISTPKSVTSEQVDTESVVTADVNSFLERSLVPDMASPMSMNSEPAHEQEPNNLLDAFTSKLQTNKVEKLIQEEINFVKSSIQSVEQGSGDLSCTSPLQQINEQTTIDIKSEIIAPEYPIQTIATPSEESKTEDLVQNEVTKTEETKEKVVEAAAVTAVAAAAVATAAAVQKKTTTTKTTKTTTAPKKPAATKPATSPTKAAPTKIAAKPAAARTTTTTTTKTNQVAKTSTAPKPAPISAAKASPKPKTPTSGAPKASEKKPLTNGDVKPAIGTTLTFRKVPLSTTSKTTTTKSVPSKLSPTKTESKTSSGTARPATAPAKTTTTVRQTTSRPTTLTTKTSTISSTLKSSTTTSSVSATKSTTKATSATSPKTTTSSTLKPRPTTAPARSKPPTSRPAPKAADTEKQIKETANKQITAASRSSMSKTTTGSVAGRTSTTTTVRKTETKVPGTRTTLTKTTTTTKTDPKKPAELIRHTTTTKTNKTGVVTKKTKTEQNGIVTELNTITVSTTNMEPQLVKDVSPAIENVVLDNLQLSETSVTD
ncbi:hypothetical protein ILUMI_06730 [Ignelater luminosus]|uniref:Uncharacterized protein n=1 Tax=Ignelater luminosus TaxID=2038154 RepID=A0A8K0GCA2_IGNLU|nr:hypothetical protein ILUMI_06730 [Ignelater luminosus]